jgi:predicted acyl esterase
MVDELSWSEVRDGMHIDWQVPIEMDDGIVLRADVFRPIEPGRYPVILTYGIYGKGLAYQDGYPKQWNKMVSDYPEILEGSSNRYQNWEVTDPERWVPDGYAIVRVDSRGAGWSPGFMNPDSQREVEDIAECIEWAGTSEWSSGKVGMLGISYYARNQWRVAGLKPKHLAAILPWEGGNDNYRDSGYHGGIMSQFRERWSREQVVNVQYGRGDLAKKNPITGQSVAGPVTLSEDELAANRRNVHEDLKAHPLIDDWHRERTAQLPLVDIPLLSCANWGGQGIHPRGNFNGFVEASSEHKWLEVHGDSHWSLFSSGYGLDLQRRFFDHFLKGIDNGWMDTPRVMLNVRYPGEKFVRRDESEWPLARTQWTTLHLDPQAEMLGRDRLAEQQSVTYETMGDGVMFWLPASDQPVEITGPLAAKLFISSETVDADLFLVLRLFDPDGAEVTFMGSTDPNTPIANGWLRASHRALDPVRSLPYRPFHPHDKVEPLAPGAVYECDVEFVPTCIVVPPGYRLGLNVRGKDYEYTGPLSDFGKEFHYATRGTGGMTHNDPGNRPPEVFDTRVTIHAGPDHDSWLLLPIIP